MLGFSKRGERVRFALTPTPSPDAVGKGRCCYPLRNTFAYNARLSFVALVHSRCCHMRRLQFSRCCEDWLFVATYSVVKRNSRSPLGGRVIKPCSASRMARLPVRMSAIACSRGISTPSCAASVCAASVWNTDPTDDRAKVEWVVHAPQGGTVRLTARHERAGVVRVECPLVPTAR